jgi:nitrate reductase molybdenum cofactor assembly chaperone NarJ/NarW
MKTFKVLSALISYPTPELQAAGPDLRRALADEAVLDDRDRLALDRLVDDLVATDIYDLPEQYLLLFDRTRSLSLHLFEHVHGESRDRGQAMIDLKALYEGSGLAISATELPDYLPMFLEYLSTRPLDEAKELLGQTAHILDAIGERLGKRGSAYAAVFRTLVSLAPPAEAEAMAGLVGEDEQPDDLAALDAAWEDKPVSFGPEAASGCRDDLIARLRAAKRPAAFGNDASTIPREDSHA